MSKGLIQSELDIAEEYIITKLFGSVENPQVNSSISTFLAIKGLSPVMLINDYIDKFEALIKPLMNKDNGYVNGEKLSKLIELKFGQKITLADCRVIEVMRALEPLINNLSNFIR